MRSSLPAGLLMTITGQLGGCDTIGKSTSAACVQFAGAWRGRTRPSEYPLPSALRTPVGDRRHYEPRGG